MAQALQFTLAGMVFEAVPVKLERKKLYGYTEIVARDARICRGRRGRGGCVRPSISARKN